jgi:hypothetical protein
VGGAPWALPCCCLLLLLLLGQGHLLLRHPVHRLDLLRVDQLLHNLRQAAFGRLLSGCNGAVGS